jgi:hypothetical protein
MAERPSKATRARDEGAPESPSVSDVQQAAVEAGVVGTSLPIGDDQVTDDPGSQTGFTGSLGTPASAPSTAPSGSTWTDQADQQDVSQYNEHDAGPRLAYVVAWNKAAVTVKESAAQTADPDTPAKVTIQGPSGNREADVAGQQVVLHRGEVLPEEAAEGEGAFLANIGAAIPVSIPAASSRSSADVDDAGDGDE